MLLALIEEINLGLDVGLFSSILTHLINKYL